MILLTQTPSFVSGYLGMSLPSGAKTSGYESEESPGDVGNKGKCFGEEKERRRHEKKFLWIIELKEMAKSLLRGIKKEHCNKIESKKEK